ncbi:MAG: Ig-like domain-containing protein [Opitutaceae bacterium]
MRSLISTIIVLALGSAASAQVAGVAITNRINGISGRVDGSLQQNQANGVTLNSGAAINGDLYVLGLPAVTINGAPTYVGTLNGTGTATPDNYSIILNSGSTVGHVIRRTNPVGITTVGAPTPPNGTRTVTISTAGQSVGSWSTLRHLTLNGGVGQYVVPAGAYGSFATSTGASLILGVAGTTEPSVYSFQSLTLNGQATLKVVGPVQILVGSAIFANGSFGNSEHPDWLILKIQTGGFTLNSGANLYGYVHAPTGEVIINSGTSLVGGLQCDRLTVNAGGTLRPIQQVTNHAPVAGGQTLAVKNNATLGITLSATDSDGDALSYAVVTNPAHGTLSGTVPNLVYTPNRSFVGTDSFTFKASDASLSSAPATITIAVTDGNVAPVATPQSLTVLEDGSIPVVLSGTDADGDPLTYSVLTQPAHGSLTGSGRNFTYTPTPLSRAADSFTFLVNDGRSDSAPATVSFTITPVNHAAVAAGQTLAVQNNATLGLTLTATDPDGDALSYTVLTDPANGTLSGSAPNLVYTPSRGFVGTDSFTFKASDASLTSAPAAITIAVTDGNVAPVATPQSLTVLEDGSIPVVLSGTDADGDPLTYSVLT